MTDHEAAGEGFRVRLTPWDERAFGFRCAEVTQLDVAPPAKVAEALARIGTWAEEQDVAYIFGRFAPERTIRAQLAVAGFSLVETSLSLSISRLGRLPRIPTSMRASLAAADDDTVQIAARVLRTDFQHGRFLEDPWITESAARRRNENWLWDLHRAGEVQIAWIGGKPVGFHVHRVNAECGSADLILTGVSGDMPGAALPTWVAALEQLAELGVERASTMVSAANAGVLNLYASLGFRVAEAHLGYRKVLRESALLHRPA